MTAALLVVVGLGAWYQYRSFREFEASDLALIRASDRIVYLDEVLTMSARMAVLTGEQRWVDRYEVAEEELARTIERATDLSSSRAVREGIADTSIANDRLVELELAALEHVGRGDPQAGMPMVFGGEYERHKSAYSAGITRSTELVNASVRRAQTVRRRIALGTSAAAALGVVMTAVFVVRYQRRRGREDRQRQNMLVMSRRLTMGALAGSIAHELNQPLGAIANYCQGARARLGNTHETSADLADVIEPIHAEAQRAGSILQRIRLLARGESGPRDEFDLADCARSAVTLVGAEVRERSPGVTIGTDLRPVVVRADRVQIEQVIVNLILNAADALRSGVLGGRDARIRVWTDTEPGRAVLCVSDPGFGIPREQLGRIFEPFYTTKPDGLGLGLLITKTIVESHDGGIDVSTDPEGTTFRVWIPRDETGTGA